MPYANGIYTADFAGGDGNGESYAPPELIGYPKEKLKVFLPDPARFPRPRLGYAWVLRLDFDGNTVSNMIGTISAADVFEFALLDTFGHAVVYMTCVRTLVGGSPETPGNALFFPSGFVPPGWTGALPPGDTLERPTPERDVAFATQHVKANAMRFGLNPWHNGGYGSSSGAVALARSALGPDLKYAHGHTGAHAWSTRLRACVLPHLQSYMPVFLDAAVNRHFPKSSDSPDYDAVASNMGDTFQECLDDAGASAFWDLVDNSGVRVLLFNDVAPVDTADFSIPHGQTETLGHSGWAGFATHARFPHFVHAVTAAVDAAVAAPPVAPDVIVETADFEAFAAAWLAANLTMGDPGYEIFDLQSEGPSERITVRRGIRDTAQQGPAFARQADHRKIRTYEVTIRKARPPERRRLSELSAKTRFGTAPMILPHKEDGFVHVAFDEPDLRYRQLSSSATDIRVRLREVIGA